MDQEFDTRLNQCTNSQVEIKSYKKTTSKQSNTAYVNEAVWTLSYALLSPNRGLPMKKKIRCKYINNENINKKCRDFQR